MLIVCPNCASTYSLTEQQLGRGRTLRCANCRHTWFAAPSADGEGAAAAESPADDAGGETGPAEAVPPPAPVQRKGRVAKTRRPPPATAEWAAKAKAALKPANVLAAALVLLLGVAILERTRVVRLLPQTARLFAAVGLPVNLRGIAFTALRSGLVQDADQSALVVEGEISNLTRIAVNVPPLAVDLRGKAGQTLYSWTAEPPKATLAPGESTSFRTRLASPPADGQDVVVRFAAAGAVAGSAPEAAH